MPQSRSAIALTTLVAMATLCSGYLPSSWCVQRTNLHIPARTLLWSAKTSTDDAFAAFADSLEEEPPKVIEKPWQAKLEDLLNPSTNLAERQILLSELLNSNEAIRKSVMDALTERKVSKVVFLCSMLDHSFWGASLPLSVAHELL